MHNNLTSFIKKLVKPFVIFTLIVALVFGQAQDALAATRGGGRMGGGSFRTPSRTYSAPSRTYSAPGGGYYPGGGFGFPFIIPFVGVGGGFGGLFTILIFFAVANFLMRSFRRVNEEGEMGYGTPTVSVSQLQIGLMAGARSLQADLNRIAQTADTGSATGLTQVLQETTLALLRHPEYWVYAGAENHQASLQSAEDVFNRLALTERSKFSRETLSNFNNQLKQAPSLGELPAAGELSTTDPGEYIVATLLVAAQNKRQLPAINSTEDARRALSQIGAIPSDELLAVEIFWIPQSEGEALSADELISEYPNLKVI